MNGHVVFGLLLLLFLAREVDVMAQTAKASMQLQALPGRTVFLRKEKDAVLRVGLRNETQAPVPNVTVSATGVAIKTEKALPWIRPGETAALEIPLPTTKLRPDAYEISVRAQAAGRQPVEQTLTYRVVNRPLPQRMPVLLWGGLPPGGLEQLKDLGFTRVFGVSVPFKPIWDAGRPLPPDREDAAVRKTWELLDEALALGMELGANISPTTILEAEDRFVRVSRDGKLQTSGKRRNVVGWHPEVIAYCRSVGETLRLRYGHHPAFTFANLNTEIRDHANVSFHPIEAEAYKRWSGQDIPAEVSGKWGVKYSNLKDFPAHRVIPDDHPILKYYTWYWKWGDGWVGLHNALHAGLKKELSRPFTTWHDPALRVASVYGSGGDLDMIGQWTYTNPDPFRVGITADELICMARGAGHPQQVFPMMQLFWYRSQTAPAPEEPEKRPANVGKLPGAWDDHDPEAQYITISPHAFREAFWTILSRPVDMLGYHGWQSLLPSDGTHAYKYTNPDTQHELKRLHRGVVEPLGATLQQIPDRPHDVAFLESFSSQMFAGRGNWGWGHGLQGARYRALLYAHLEPEVIYEETVREQGLDRYKVLFLLDCDVLPQSVYEKVVAFQKRGGRVIGDRNLCPAIRADITLPEIELAPEDNERDKAQVLQAAADLREALKNKYKNFADSDDPEILLHTREKSGVHYLFAVSDKRKYGDYVGKYRRMMEDGLPNRGAIRVARATQHVYDLVNGGQAPFQSRGGQTTIDVEFEPCGGRLFVLTDQEIGSLAVTGPESARLGGTLSLECQLLDTQRKPMQGVWPLKIEITDPQGRPAEGSGWYGAENGTQTITLDLAENDRAGVWKVRVRDFVTGSVEEKAIQVVSSLGGASQ
jgi:hypothetical protein